jgi:hypothetical protein
VLVLEGASEARLDPDFGALGVAIIEELTFLNSAAPGADPRFRYWTTEQINL